MTIHETNRNNTDITLQENDNTREPREQNLLQRTTPNEQ